MDISAKISLRHIGVCISMLPLLLACSHSSSPSPLVGVWRYAGEVDTKPDGSPAPVAALSNTQGLLIYTADGHMSVNLMPVSRAWASDTATPDQLRETIVNGTAYAGTYELDPKAHTITHVVSVSMEPQYETQRLTRRYSLDGDTLKLMGTFPYGNDVVHFTITWNRVVSSPPTP